MGVINIISYAERLLPRSREIRRDKAGFTFIELIIVMGIIIIILPVLFGIVLVLSRQQVKVYRLSEVKREGDFALNRMTHTIRNYATGVYSDIPFTEDDEDADPPDRDNRLCDNSTEDTIYPATTYMRDRFDNYFNYSLSDNSITSSSSVLASPLVLTSNRVNISNLKMTCRTTSDFSSSIIEIEFDVGYKYPPGITPKTFENASLHYATRIKLRND